MCFRRRGAVGGGDWRMTSLPLVLLLRLPQRRAQSRPKRLGLARTLRWRSLCGPLLRETPRSWLLARRRCQLPAVGFGAFARAAGLLA